jgi:hypothetical protein
MPESTMAARATIARRLRFQGHHCRSLGSPLYADLLERAAGDVERGGATWAVLRGHEADPGPSALALRLMGAVHRLVLEGRAAALARWYPSAGGGGDPAAAWPDFVAALDEHRELLRPLIDRPVQTNEVGRAGALLGGFLLVGLETRLPLRLLELGASAGLLLRWDRFHYRTESCAWGDPDSAVRLTGFVKQDGLPHTAIPAVVERSGCDPEPLDPLDERDCLTLRSYVWADQPERLARLGAALEVARQVPARVDRARAVDWLSRELARDARGTATVVFHSVVRQYLPGDEQAKLDSYLRAAAALASPGAPLAWLRMEPVPGTFEVRLTTWPGERELLLATCDGHGARVCWLA